MRGEASRVAADAEAIQAPLLRRDGQPMKGWDEGAPIDREVVIRGLENDHAADALKFAGHLLLVGPVSDMADHGMREHHIEGVIGIPGQVAGVSDDGRERLGRVLGEDVQEGNRARLQGLPRHRLPIGPCAADVQHAQGPLGGHVPQHVRKAGLTATQDPGIQHRDGVYS